MSAEQYMTDMEVKLVKDERTETSWLAEFFLTGLRMIDGLSLNEAEHKLGMAIPEKILSKIDTLKERGELIVENDDTDKHIKIPVEKLIFADKIIYSLVEDIL